MHLRGAENGVTTFHLSFSSTFLSPLCLIWYRSIELATQWLSFIVNADFYWDDRVFFPICKSIDCALDTKAVSM